MSVAITFERLHKRKPSDDDLKRIYEIGGAVGAGEDDVFLSLIVALDYYHGIFGEAPDAIKKAVSASVEAATKEAQGRVKILTATAVESASEAVQKAAAAAARGASIKSAAQWISGGIVIASLTLALMAKVIYSNAFEAGRASGIADQKNAELYIQSRNTWASSEQGRKAFKMAEDGTLDLLLTCKGDGWKIQDGACFPLANSKKEVQGWMLP